jgi:cytochrome P450
MEEAGTKRNGSYTVDISILHDSRGIMTADPENIEALLGTNKLSEYGKGEYLRQNFREFVGDSILTLDGQPWHDLRRVMRPIFNKERVGDLRVFEKHVQNLVSHLGPGDGSEIDIQSLFAKYSMDVAIGFLLDTEDHNLNHPGGEFAQMWDEIQHMQAMILRAG